MVPPYVWSGERVLLTNARLQQAEIVESLLRCVVIDIGVVGFAWFWLVLNSSGTGCISYFLHSSPRFVLSSHSSWLKGSFDDYAGGQTQLNSGEVPRRVEERID